MLGPEEWGSIMEACYGLLEGGGWDVELFTSVIWSAAVYGRLDDPSTLRFIQGLRRLVEGLRDALLAAKASRPLILLLLQVRGYDWLAAEGDAGLNHCAFSGAVHPGPWLGRIRRPEGAPRDDDASA
jgi:hypothetical protein